jgi:DNA replication protein DnaC
LASAPAPARVELPSIEESNRILQRATQQARAKAAEQTQADGNSALAAGLEKAIEPEPETPKPFTPQIGPSGERFMMSPSGKRINLPPEPSPEEQERRDQQQRERERDEKRRQLQERANWLRSKSEVPRRFTQASMNNLGDVEPGYRATGERLVGMMDVPQMYAMLGTRGGGKTHLACAVIHAFCDAGKAATYQRATDIFLAIKRTWGKRGESEDRVIDGLAKVSLLVIDELQVRSDTPWEDTILTDLIDRRYADMRSTILIANQTLEQFSERMGDSVVSRLTQMGGIMCNWQTRRVPGMVPEQVPPPAPLPGSMTF